MTDRESPSNGEWAVCAQGVTKSFGSVKALRGVNLKLGRGEFLTIFGPNGAGKTTLLRMLSGLIRPSSGSISIAGFDLKGGSAKLRRQIGMVSHNTFLYGDLTAWENLRFYGRMYEVDNLDDRIRQAIGQVGLEHRSHDLVRTFSHGMRQRLSIARAILHEPYVLFLDEPYTGLDQQAAEMLRGLLESLRVEDRATIMTTHNLERGLGMCDQVAILNGGRLVYQAKSGSMDAEGLKEVYRRYTGEYG